MNLIVIISLIIIDLLLLKQYNQQTNILLSFLSIYAKKHFLQSACFLECGCIACGFSFRGIILS
ncbi:hypothetical protein JT221_04950 [Helicobacter pylori]|nr:hypothetical protein [Helicobacter pylori]